MHLYLDTSTSTAVLRLENLENPKTTPNPTSTTTKEYQTPLGHTMAEKLLGFLRDKLAENQKTWSDIQKITFYSGPGSFTGLRIGASVVNALAHELQIPLFDHHGQKHDIIIPDYGRPANITV